MANKNKTLYRLTYRVDGKVCFAEMYAAGDRLRTLFTPSKNAHRFEGWQNLPERMPDSDLTIDGAFTPLSYELIFMLDGQEFAKTELPYGAQIVGPKVPAKDGYEFTGWEGMPETMPAEPLTLSGKYIRDSYTLTYLVDDKHRYVVHLPYGAKIEPLQTPVKDQHVFTGWIDLPETMPADDIVVAGRFEMRTFRLTRIVDGEVFMAEDLHIGEKVDKKVKPVKPGYYFSGWRKLPDTMPDHDITAVTSMYPVRYRVDYEIDGEIWRTTYVPYTSEFVADMPEDRPGFRFLGWSDAPAVMPMQDIVVHGSFEELPAEEPAPMPEPEIPETVLYTLRYLLDGETVCELSLAEGDAVIAPEMPERVGYRFDGFPGIPETMPASDLSLEASYQPLTFDLTFLANGETVSKQSLTYGAALTAPEGPAREGYTFVGWGELPETMPASDLSFEASYDANLYRVSFRVEDTLLSEETLPFGAAITVPTPEARLGAIFGGFGDVPTVMPASDLVFDGAYQTVEYRLSFVLDGEEISSAMLPFGAEIALPEAEERPGYRFLGWSAPASMPAEDLTVCGSYEQILYTLSAVIDGQTFYSAELPAGDGFVLPEPDAKEGYSFAWENRTGVMPIGDLTVGGAYTALTYTLSFVLDGEMLSTLTLPYGEAVSAPDAPAREGYSFLGWKDLPETVPAGDLTVEGSYSQNLYSLRFAVDGETVSESSLPAFAPISAPDAEARVGYGFAWAETPSVMPASDLVIEGSYTKLAYVLRLTVEDDTVLEQSLTYGDAISLPEMPAREGYTFAWADAPAEMPASDLYIEGVYRANTYALRFVSMGETVSETAVPYGAAVSAPEAPVADGWRFLGWDALPETMPASDLTCTALFEQALVHVEFRFDGEAVACCDLPAGAALIVPEMPVREGYGFAWSELPDAVPTADTVIEGVYTANSFRLLCLADGEAILDTELAYGSEIKLPTPEPREGFSFAWGDAPATMPASDLTVEGAYQAELYTLTFSVDGEILSSTELPFGEAIVLPAEPSKIGHTFSGFGTIPETMPAENLVFNATFVCNSYRLSVLVSGESLLDTSLLYGAPIELPEAEEREGYTFDGFGEVPATMPANDLVIASDYTACTYRMTFELDGNVISDMDLSYGSRILLPILEIPEGRSFGGWGEVPATMPASDLKLSAATEPVTYRLTYLLNGETVLEAEVAVGDALPMPEIAEEEGYTFSGYEVPETMPAEDLVLEATRVLNSYLLTVKLDGETLVSEEIPYGSEIALPEISEKPGYTFSGWGDVPASMPASDLSIEGSYVQSLYRVSFLVDGAALLETELALGAELPIPASPEREGYTFSGWGELPSAMPAEDLVFTASLTCNSYRLTFLLNGESVLDTDALYGSAIELPEVSFNEKQIFSGWGDVPASMPASDLTFSATLVDKTYTLRFVYGEEILSEQVLKEGDAIEAIALPAEELFWSNLPSEMPDYDVTVAATALPAEEHTVRFIVDGEPYAEIKVMSGETIALPETPVQNGMEFIAWENLPETMPREDVETAALFRIALYKASFRIDGAPYAENLYCEGAVIPEPFTPAKPGYTFSGWKNFVGNMPDYDFTAFGSYEPNLHTVRFLANGEEILCSTIAFGEALTAPEAPKVADAAFLGWDALPETMPDEDLTVEALYSYPSYRLTYRLDGAVYYETDLVVGRALPKLNPPARYGMTFGGWQNFPDAMPDYDLTVYGNYLPTYRTVTYLSMGEEIAVRRYRVGDSVVSIDGSNPAIGEFEGWFDLPAVMPDEDVVATARYKARTYCITYLLDGKPVATQNVAVGDTVRAPIPPLKADHVFREWENLPEIMPANDLIVSGVYDSTVSTIIYRVDGEEIRRAVYPIGATIKPIAAPEKVHDKFVGWSNFTDVMPAYDFAVDAVYEPNICSYSFVIDGETILEGTMRAGDPLLAPVPEERPSLDFVGFDGYDGLMPASDVVYVGRYEPKLYQLCFLLDGEVWRTLEFHEGDAVTDADEAPSLALGYRFSGWSAIPEVMPNHDVDVLGTTEPISYKLTVIAENRTVAEKEIPFGSILSSYKAPRRHGFVFKGWEGLPEFMPAADITVSGRYEASEPIYSFYSLPVASCESRDMVAVSQPDEKRVTVKKGSFSNVIYVSGDRIQVVANGKSFELDISEYVCDGDIIDRNALGEAVYRLATIADPARKVASYQLIIDHIRSLDTLVEVAAADEQDILTVVRDRMLTDADEITVPAFSYSVLAANEKEGTVQIAASVVDDEYFRAIQDAMTTAGFNVAAPMTPQMGMIAYMQTRTIQKKSNALVVTLTGGYLMLGLYLNGKLYATSKNAVPFDLPTADLSAELEAQLSMLSEHLELEDVSAKIEQIFYAGFRVERIKPLVKQMRKTVRKINRSPRRALASGFTVKKPAAYEISFPFVKRRKKVYHVTGKSGSAKS